MSILLLFVSVGDFNDNFYSIIPYDNRILIGVSSIILSTINNNQLMVLLESDDFAVIFQSFQDLKDTDDVEIDGNCGLVPLRSDPIPMLKLETIVYLFTTLFYVRITLIVVGLFFIVIGISKTRKQKQNNLWTFNKARWYKNNKIYQNRSRLVSIGLAFSYFPMLIYSLIAAFTLIIKRMESAYTESLYDLEFKIEDSILIENNLVRAISIICINVTLCVSLFFKGIRNKTIHSADILGVYFVFCWSIIYFNHGWFDYNVGVLLIVMALCLPGLTFTGSVVNNPRFLITYIRNEIKDTVLYFKSVTKRLVFVKTKELYDHPINSVFLVLGIVGLLCVIFAVFLPLYDLSINSGPLVDTVTERVDEIGDDIDDLIGGLTELTLKFDPCYEGMQFTESADELDLTGNKDISTSKTEIEIEAFKDTCGDDYEGITSKNTCRKKIEENDNFFSHDGNKLKLYEKRLRDDNYNKTECIEGSLVPVFDSTCRDKMCNGFLGSLIAIYSLSLVPFVGSVAMPLQISTRVLKTVFKLGKRFIQKVRKLSKNRKRYRKVMKIFKRVKNFFKSAKDKTSDLRKTIFTIKRSSLAMVVPTFIIGILSFNLGFWSRRVSNNSGTQLLFVLCLSCAIANTILLLTVLFSNVLFLKLLEMLPAKIFIFNFNTGLGITVLSIGICMTILTSFWLSFVFFFGIQTNKTNKTRDTVPTNTNAAEIQFKYVGIAVNEGVIKKKTKQYFGESRYSIASLLISWLLLAPVIYIIVEYSWPFSNDLALIFEFKADENQDMLDLRTGNKDLADVSASVSEVRDESKDIKNACDLVETIIGKVAGKLLEGKIYKNFDDLRRNVTEIISNGLQEMIDSLNLCRARSCSLNGNFIDTLQNLLLFGPIVFIIMLLTFITFASLTKTNLQRLDTILYTSIAVIITGVLTLSNVYGMFSLFDGVKIPFFDLVVHTSNGYYLGIFCYLLCTLAVINIFIGFSLNFK